MIRVSPLKVGQSRWVVCSGNPINHVDPDGLQEWDPNTYNPYERRVQDRVLDDEQMEAARARWETTSNLVIFAASSASPDPSDAVGGLFVAGGLLLRGLGKYGRVKGHHVHAKSAFKNHPNYRVSKAFSVSNEFMDSKGWDHQLMTNMQRKLFKSIDDGTLPNTLTSHTAIAVEALVAGGASRAEARSLVAKSLQNLRDQGVYFPTDVPWHGKRKGTYK